MKRTSTVSYCGKDWPRQSNNILVLILGVLWYFGLVFIEFMTYTGRNFGTHVRNEITSNSV